MDYLKNLVAMAVADGNIDASEIELLRKMAGSAGVSEEKLNEWIENAQSVAVKIPDNDKEKEKHLINMISMATADGSFSKEEYKLCKRISDKLGYDGMHLAHKRFMNKDHLKNMVAMATIDGKLNHRELDLLRDAALEAGLPEFELRKLIFSVDEYRDSLPVSSNNPEIQIIQIISMAIADGDMVDKEYEFCKNIATQLGFTERDLEFITRLSFRKDVALPAQRTNP